MLGNTNSAVPSAKEVLENIKTYASSVKTDLHNVCEEKKEEIGALVTTAQTTATNSANSASEAGRSAAAAAESATAAQAAATNSANSATAAGASATAAANSATAAQEAATNSSNSASAAGTSATSAASSATSAQEAATSSANSASAAEDSATAAANSATAAQATASNMANITYTKDEIDDLIEQTDLLPEQTGNSGKFLTTNGTEASWSNVGSGLEIGDIGIAPLGIDERKGLRRYLNGTILSDYTITPEFADKLEAAAKLNSSLICTDSEWQEIANASNTGSCGKFARILSNSVGELNFSSDSAYGFSTNNYFKYIDHDIPSTGTISSFYKKIYQIGLYIDIGITEESFIFSTLDDKFAISIFTDEETGYSYLKVYTNDNSQTSTKGLPFDSFVNIEIQTSLQAISIKLIFEDEPEYNWFVSSGNIKSLLQSFNTIYIGKTIKNGADLVHTINLKDTFIKYTGDNDYIWKADNFSYRLPKINCFIEGLNNLTSLGNLASLKMSTTLGTKYIESIKYPYFIQVATGSEDEVNITNEIQLNNPFFFGMSLYSDSDPNNISWLISNGTYHSGTVYSGFYQWLLKNYNGTEVTEGVSVKANTASDITDYDYVINTTETTFRLPVSVNNTEVNYYSARPLLDAGLTDPGISDPGEDIGIGEVTGAKLYFYVGETVQNAHLIDAGRISEKVTTLVDKDSSSDKNLVIDWSMPDYSSKVAIPFTTSMTTTGQTYTAPASGIIFGSILVGADVSVTTFYIYVNGSIITKTGDNSGPAEWLNPSVVLVSKGDVYKLTSENDYTAAGIQFYFCPCKGAN